MTGEEAHKLAMQGVRVRRKAWPEDWYWSTEIGHSWTGRTNLLENDWELYEPQVSEKDSDK